MLRYLGWNEAADLIIKGVAGTIKNGELTFDLANMNVRIVIEALHQKNLMDG